MFSAYVFIILACISMSSNCKLQNIYAIQIIQVFAYCDINVDELHIIFVCFA